MSTRAFMIATGIVLLISAVNTAFHGMWAQGGMDAFAGDWSRRLEADERAAALAQAREARTTATEAEIFNNLNGFVGHHLSRVILWSLGVQGLGGFALIGVAAFGRPHGVRRTGESRE